MATLSVVATVELGNVPPRVKLVVTDTGTPAITSVTVTRTDSSGNVVPVRTDDGAPLALVTSGGNWVGTVYDYEMPYGQAVTYSTLQQPGTSTAPVTVDEDEIWLVHPGIPDRSMPITLMKGANDEEEEDVNAGVFYPLGRREAVVISDGKRKAPSSELIVGTETPAEAQALKDLLSDAFPLLLNVPPLTGVGLDTAYIFVGGLRRRRQSDIGSAPQRVWSLPYRVVAMPVGGSQSQWTFQDVLDQYPTFQDVLDAFPTFADLQAPTN